MTTKESQINSDSVIEKFELDRFENRIDLTERSERRKDWHEKAKHILAFIVIVSIIIYFFVHMIFYSKTEIPDLFKYFVGFGSTIVAYYFFKEQK